MPGLQLKKALVAHAQPELIIIEAGSRGFEPPVSSVTGWHVRPLHHEPPANVNILS
jgi:hypothetical protein